MNKEDYNKRIEDKMDKQTGLLIGIKDDVSKEVSILKLAQQKLKYGMMFNASLMLMVISIEYPKLVKFLKGF